MCQEQFERSKKTTTPAMKAVSDMVEKMQWGFPQAAVRGGAGSSDDKAGESLSFDNEAVSYTHLTLPTICSV
eukprot:2120687-Alexandrium_andersonii.AAC.1